MIALLQGHLVPRRARHRQDAGGARPGRCGCASHGSVSACMAHALDVALGLWHVPACCRLTDARMYYIDHPPAQPIHPTPPSRPTVRFAGACAKHSPVPVTFFARKGADCLGKFHGEAERTLRLLFEEVGFRLHCPFFSDSNWMFLARLLSRPTCG